MNVYNVETSTTVSLPSTTSPLPTESMTSRAATVKKSLAAEPMTTRPSKNDHPMDATTTTISQYELTKPTVEETTRGKRSTTSLIFTTGMILSIIYFTNILTYYCFTRFSI